MVEVEGREDLASEALAQICEVDDEKGPKGLADAFLPQATTCRAGLATVEGH